MLLPLTFLAGCGGKDQGDVYIPEAPIEVSFGTDPETPHPAGEPITLYVQVTQEGEPVEDADEVQFEIWQEDDQVEENGAGSSEEEADDEADPGEDAEAHEPGGEKQGPAFHGGSMADYQSDHPFYDAEHAGDGIYTLEHIFEEPGVYQVMYHVTARGYHDMVKYEVEIVE